MPQQYPFSALVGADESQLDQMSLALVLSTIAEDIGGVLIRGEKGTAKSTAVRALTAVLPEIQVVAGDRFSSDPADPSPLSPDAPFADPQAETRPVRLVELPVGATEDRLLGSLDLSDVLAEGKVSYEPGLLAKAHRGILYVDEVNLLHDHLVDMLLDAAAMGRATVERDNISIEHAAKFVLIGTMNPEEGELRPQLLDRFGLTVEVAAPREPQRRVEVVRRRMAYDADPDAFAAQYADQEKALHDRVIAARELVPRVQLGEGALIKIAEVCAAFEVDGLRADIVTARTAVTHAAWQGRRHVTRDDIRAAALLALPHRRRRNPFDAPGLDEKLLDRILGDEEPDPEPEPPQPEGAPEDDAQTEAEAPDESTSPAPPEPEPAQPPEADATDQNTDSAPPTGEASDLVDDSSAEQETEHEPEQPEPEASAPAPRESTDVAGAPVRAKKLQVRGLGAGATGRRSPAITSTGRRIGPAPTGTGSGIHFLETVRVAAMHQHERGRSLGRMQLATSDLRSAVRQGQEANLVLFCVDASGSMAARKRMSQVKTAILSLLLDAYRRRDKVGLVTFRGDSAEVTLPPTRSVDVAASRLDEIAAGGRTPLAAGLLEAAAVLNRERIRDPQLRPLLVVVTDGRATGGHSPIPASQQAADFLAQQAYSSVVIDCENGPMRMGLAIDLAARLHAEHLPIAEITADDLTRTVRERAA